jgi:transposase
MQVYTGIDWSENKHDVVVMNQAGAEIAQLTIPHTPEGFLKLDAARVALGVAPQDCVVGLETAHNLLIDFLWSRQYDQVYVIPPSVTKSNRGRFGSSRKRTDRSDAVLLASFLSSPRMRFAPQVWFSLAMRLISATTSSVSGGLPGFLSDLDLRLQKLRNKSRCQRRTVSG